jgi:hypothetical protein
MCHLADVVLSDRKYRIVPICSFYMVPVRHNHLLLFSGVGTESVLVQKLREAEEKFHRTNRDGVKVYSNLSNEHKDISGAVNVEGKLHNRYGFKGSGFVYDRPDSYVAQIGPLSSMYGCLGGD